MTDPTEISASGGGWHARIKGLDLADILLLVVLAAGCGSLWLEVHSHDQHTAEQHRLRVENDARLMEVLLRVIQNQTSISTSLTNVVSEVGFGNKEIKATIVEAGDATNYILSLSQGQRELLRLEMPKTIRERVKVRRPKEDE